MTKSSGRTIDKARTSLVVVMLCFGVAALFTYGSGYRLLSVQSDSMAPAIRAKDAVFISTRATDIRINDVVTYASPQNPKILLTHRVTTVEPQKGTFMAKGDNVYAGERNIPLTNLRGVMVSRIPRMGNILDAFWHPLGLIITVYLPAAAIVFGEIRRLSGYCGGHHSGYYEFRGRAY